VHSPISPSNPYPAPPSLMAHKVWILDCKNCHVFLTNRGMKAVLLLRPNVSLYSSDALPVNCSPYDSNSDALCRSPTDNKSSISPRTCECLTQSLCCHGCGSTIGYMIIVPCSRCTSSLSETNRATNGHRFVFQSSEVMGTERHYIPNEKDIIPFVTTTGINTVQPYTYPTPQSNIYHTDNRADSYGQTSPIESLSTAPTLEFTNIIDYSQQQPFEHDSWTYRGRRVYPSPFQPRMESHVVSSSPNSSHYTTDQKYAPTMPSVLKGGDVIFWHHLARSGEILEVVDDERARRPAESAGDFDR